MPRTLVIFPNRYKLFTGEAPTEYSSEKVHPFR